MEPECRLGKRNVKKVAVFGNAGGGKSTLARKLAELTHIPLYPLDMIQLCHRHLTPKYREFVSAARRHQRVYHLRSAAEVAAFLNGIRPETQSA
jgi:AAA+ superfamily predicted ATPase